MGFYFILFFFLNRINLINGLVQTFGLKQVVIWAYFVIMDLLFGFFIFGYSKLGLLNQGVHNFYLRVFTILFKLRTSIYKKKKISFDFSKSQGVQLNTLPST